MFLDALQDIIRDEGFHLPTPPAREALETARSILEWSGTNKQHVTTFSIDLAQQLRECIPT